jgi:hypothetical protein
MFLVLSHMERNKIGSTILCCTGSLPSAMVITDGSYWALTSVSQASGRRKLGRAEGRGQDGANFREP